MEYLFVHWHRSGILHLSRVFCKQTGIKNFSFDDNLWVATGSDSDPLGGISPGVLWLNDLSCACTKHTFPKAELNLFHSNRNFTWEERKVLWRSLNDCRAKCVYTDAIG